MLSTTTTTLSVLLLRRRRHLLGLGGRSVAFGSGSGAGDDPERPSKARVAGYYRSLGLEPGGTKDQVRRQYIVMAKRFHPDTPGTGSLEKFQEIDQVIFNLNLNF